LAKLSWPARLYIGAVIAAAVVLLIRGPFGDLAWWREVAVLGVLLVVFESTATLLRPKELAWSPSPIATLAAAVLVGPVGAALVGACTAFGLRRGPSLIQRVFNTGMFAVSAYLAGEAFIAMGGRVGMPGAGSFPGVIGPFVVAAVVHAVTNHGLLGGVLWLTSSREPQERRTSIGMSFELVVSDLGYGAFGLLIAALWNVTGLFAPVLVLIPVAVARWAMTQIVEQQRAYQAAVGALCQAVETKDLYTRGHSDRVSRGSVMIAREVGMRGERVEAIRFAGMLHDVGKLGVPTRVLQKTGKLTEEEYAAIQLHPMRGLDIVREIGFLDEALAGIMHHHERIDGRGYPMGLAGDEIPEFARILAVADAFDSMTSTRSYRGARPVVEAIAELRKWAGTQFDPAFVDAFVAAIGREGWQRPEPSGAHAADLPATPSHDHDDPGSPLRVIARQRDQESTSERGPSSLRP
jgi:HD domain